MRQRIAEKLVKEGDGGTKRLSQLQGELFSVSARVNEESLNLVCFDILTLTQSASSGELLVAQSFCSKEKAKMFILSD